MPAIANHGPGASGGGSATISGETLKPGHFELSLREDFSQFEKFNNAQAAAQARSGGDFDSLDHGFITSVDFALGLVSVVLKLPPSSGLGMFLVGRSVGWIAHAIEQYATGTLIRPRARYVGVLPF